MSEPPSFLLKFMSKDKKESIASTEAQHQNKKIKLFPEAKNVINPAIIIQQDNQIGSVSPPSSIESNTGKSGSNDAKKSNQPNIKKNITKKSNNPKKKQKKKLLDNLPTGDAENSENAPLFEIPTEIPDSFNYIKPNNNLEIAQEFRVNPDWESDLISWFVRLRTSFYQITSNIPDLKLTDIIKSIQKGEMPLTNLMCSFMEIDEILFYFDKKTKTFSKSDLAWLFSALIFSDRYISGEIVSCLERILTKLIAQLNSTESTTNPLYPYIIVDITIIMKFFHKP